MSKEITKNRGKCSSESSFIFGLLAKITKSFLHKKLEYLFTRLMYLQGSIAHFISVLEMHVICPVSQPLLELIFSLFSSKMCV